MTVLVFLLPYILFIGLFSWASIGSFNAARKAFRENEVVLIGSKVITGKATKVIGFVFYIFSVIFGLFVFILINNFIH